jgi:hypothetical protein
MSRKKFLRVCGAMLAGGAVAATVGVLQKRSVSNSSPVDIVPANDSLRVVARKPTLHTPYRLVSAFATSGAVEAFAVHGDRLCVASNKVVYVYNRLGTQLNQFTAGEEIRDMAVIDDETLYLLHPKGVSTYTSAGEQQRSFQACSELSDYCSMAVAAGRIFVTDVLNKNICIYTTDGRFVRFVSSPNGFIIPSRTFGIEAVGNVLYCSNSGRHQVEKYSPDGQYLGCFGQHGTAAGMFTGCCNPVYLSGTASGDIITSEKGDPRISCYASDGTFRTLLLDGGMMGGGKIAYHVRVHDDRIFVAGRKQVSVFRYDPQLAQHSGCAGCEVGCGLRG